MRQLPVLQQTVNERVFTPTTRAVYANNEAPLNNEPYKVPFKDENIGSFRRWVFPSKVLPCQLPPKELNPGSFIVPCTIESLNLYALADLGASGDNTYWWSDQKLEEDERQEIRVDIEGYDPPRIDGCVTIGKEKDQGSGDGSERKGYAKEGP
ncbi:hypothetical protein Tco_0385403 [Tanacetum coccineum]